MKICYVNPAILLRRPIAELIKNFDKSNQIGLLIPKKLFKPIDNSLHYSKMPINVKVYTYSVIEPPFGFEVPIPITPMACIQTIRVFLNYDIIHMWAHFYPMNLLVNKIKLFFPRKKLIMTIDSFPGYSFSSGKLMDALFKIYTKLFGWFVYGIPNIISIYGKSLIPFAKQSGINIKKLVVTPTGINLKKFETPIRIEKEFNIPKNSVKILFVGLLNKRKAVDVILNVLAKQKNFIMLIVGDGPQRKKLEDMAVKLGIKDKVIFTGFRKDIGRFYKSADLLFFPSRGEGLAGAIMEAMLSKIPVLTTKIPCTTDLIEDNINGFLCPIGDIQCFSKKLKILLEDKKLREKMGEEGYRKIQTYDWKNRFKVFLELYK
jgi:glycosyltransferase involved in cell wall biosynthesis